MLDSKRMFNSAAEIIIYSNNMIDLGSAVATQPSGRVIYESFHATAQPLQQMATKIRVGGFWNAWRTTIGHGVKYCISYSDADNFFNSGTTVITCDDMGAADLIENLRPGRYILFLPGIYDAINDPRISKTEKLFRRQFIMTAIKNKAYPEAYVISGETRSVDYETPEMIYQLDMLEYTVIQNMGVATNYVMNNVIDRAVNDHMDDISTIVLNQLLEVGDQVELTIRPNAVGCGYPPKVTGVITEKKQDLVGVLYENTDFPTWVRLRFVKTVDKLQANPSAS